MTTTNYDDIVTKIRQALTDSKAEVKRLEAALVVLNGDTKPAAPAPTKRAPTRRAKPKKLVAVNYAEVAGIARAAHENGKAMGRAVADHYGIPLQNASVRVSKARRLGHKIPASKNGRPRTQHE